MSEVKTKKVLINTCYGGFCLSEQAVDLLAKKKNIQNKTEKAMILRRINNRSDPHLLEVVEELGLEKCSVGSTCKLSLVEIPDDVEYEIQENDGVESIHEKHRVWY